MHRWRRKLSPRHLRLQQCQCQSLRKPLQALLHHFSNSGGALSQYNIFFFVCLCVHSDESWILVTDFEQLDSELSDRVWGFYWLQNLNPFVAALDIKVHCHCVFQHTRVGTLIVATIYLQLIQNRYMFWSFTVLKCSHQHCVQVEVTRA